jgi:hypothetical protein
VCNALTLLPKNDWFTLHDFRIAFEQANKFDNIGFGVSALPTLTAYTCLQSLRKSLNIDPIAYLFMYCQSKVQFEKTPKQLGFWDETKQVLLEQSKIADELKSDEIRMKCVKSHEELMREAAQKR